MKNHFNMIGIRVLLFCLMIPKCLFTKKEETNDEKLTKGMVGEAAELAHFTLRFGYVDYRNNDLFDIEKFLELMTDHEIRMETWTPELWQEMIQEILGTKTNFCQDTLKDPVLEENQIFFDKNAGEASIQLDSKDVVFFRYKRMPIRNHLVKCPITVQGKGGYSAYITPFERTTKEEDENFYFILLDLYYENIRSSTPQVVVAMRTKLGATVPLLQKINEFVKNYLNLTTFRLAVQ